MKVITYLAFTVLSIFIQFCVMDFIQEKIQTHEINVNVDAKVTSRKEILNNLLKNISNKPHALYFRTHPSKFIKRSPITESSITENTLSNSTVPAKPPGTTDIPVTIFDVLYDDNISTTESFFITTEMDNVTEITLFEIKNKSTISNTVPTTAFNKYCGCNLLYKICDINCCCDPDCSEEYNRLFQCEQIVNVKGPYTDGCILYLFHNDLSYGSSTLNNLFCVVKTNLPDKNNIKQPDLKFINKYKTWSSVPQRKAIYEFKKTMYKNDDPIWLFKNGTIFYLDFATPMVNNYCTDRTPIVFLKNRNVRCMVNFDDLEMFRIIHTAQASMIISAKNITFNSSVLNCSNLHCVNWTILMCDNDICRNYNKSSDEAFCTNVVCTKLALKIDYYFYYYDFKIVNATIKLHLQNRSMTPFMMQEISIQFVMANNSVDRIIELSGSPGYIQHLPIIISKVKSNYTEDFFNRTSGSNYMSFPGNQYGLCTLSNTSLNIVRFGLNMRSKCRYVFTRHSDLMKSNASMICKSIEDNINSMLGLDTEVYVSPFGNPYGIRDENWIKLQKVNEEDRIMYGEYSARLSKLRCFNLINRISLRIVFSNVNEKDSFGQNKILLAKYDVAVNNASFDIEEISTVITTDIIFVDATNPDVYVYASTPHLNINLPKDFFFPFPSNICIKLSSSYNVIIFGNIIILIANKITLQ